MTKRQLIVAIDGPAGAGKSTVAKRLAAVLNYKYIDTGAMYRTVTLKAMRAKLDLADRAAVEDVARKSSIEFVAGQTGKVLLDGEDVSREIRSPEVTRNVSAYVASYPGVRREMVARQQAMGAAGGVVMEGRDITTVVFPKAEIKVFLDASQEERARRRYEELKSQGREQPFAELLADLRRRDQEDLNRPGGALKRVPGALVVNTTGKTIDQVIAAILRPVRRREPRPPMKFLYWFVLNSARLAARLFFHFRTYHEEILPTSGPFILASNHASHLDPPCLAIAVPHRDIHFMARSTLFRPRPFGWLIRNVNAHPIVRGQGPNQDWDSFVRVLKNGGALLVFPEGTRTLDGELQRGKSGFGKLVHMSQVPVYPAYVAGSFQAWPKAGKVRFRPVSVRFGAPVPLDDLFSQAEEKRVLREISDRVMAAIAALKKESEKGG